MPVTGSLPALAMPSAGPWPFWWVAFSCRSAMMACRQIRIGHNCHTCEGTGLSVPECDHDMPTDSSAVPNVLIEQRRRPVASMSHCLTQ